VLMLGAGGGNGRAAAADPAPLSSADVRSVAQAFGAAYETEDPAALARLLTSDVQRLLPASAARGRSAVAAAYARQFAGQRTTSYDLIDLQAGGGRTGRASAGYRVGRDGARTLAGRIVFDVVRDGGRPRIALLAVTPAT
jgi:ketosteroid isomerase-like protein